MAIGLVNLKKWERDNNGTILHDFRTMGGKMSLGAPSRYIQFSLPDNYMYADTLVIFEEKVYEICKYLKNAKKSLNSPFRDSK